MQVIGAVIGGEIVLVEEDQAVAILYKFIPSPLLELIHSNYGGLKSPLGVKSFQKVKDPCLSDSVCTWSNVACNSRVPSARVLAVAVCQNCLTRESQIVGLEVKAYLRLEPLRKSTISANPALSSGLRKNPT
ncbi:hypothetical protein Tco_0682669 [Tanacetum coccineum]|uniref:Uncharacterized protein n=1 Tax=Tanacetum coccineum TaxID=301880 RepID=A0ABQ4XRT0_9ASTR